MSTFNTIIGLYPKNHELETSKYGLDFSRDLTLLFELLHRDRQPGDYVIM